MWYLKERIYKTEPKSHTHRDVINKVVKSSVKAKTTEHWPDIPLTIPRQQVFNVSACKIFDIKHSLEVIIIILTLILLFNLIKIKDTSKCAVF